MLADTVKIKILSEKERAAYESVLVLNLQDAVIPFQLDGNSVVMSLGKTISMCEVDFEKLYNECLKPLYSIQFRSYSPGIYSFWGLDSNVPICEQYCEYLRNQIHSINDTKILPRWLPLASYIKNNLLDSLALYEDSVNSTKFSLLHGDLFSGNILTFEGKYKLIDLEYMRFGPIQSELAFFLIWDILNADIPFPDSVTWKNLPKLGYKWGLSGAEILQVRDIYIPLIILFAVYALSQGCYSQPKFLESGLVALENCLQTEGKFGNAIFC